VNHESYADRKKEGDEAEARFCRDWQCRCGGAFERGDGGLWWRPDFKCRACGQRVDVKHCTPKHPSISSQPFDGYEPQTIVAWLRGRNEWLGQTKAILDQHREGPFPPAHADHGTPFYRFPVNVFKPLGGFLRKRMAELAAMLTMFP
jgi:hypothetical protein